MNLNRSSLYYAPQPENAENLAIMRVIDQVYTEMPFYGVLRMTAELRKNRGYPSIGTKRVRRLMRLMGLEALYPKPRTSVPNKEHVIYPYLLRGVSVVRPNQVWAADITYIRMNQGFAYLVAVMDWHSRYVLSWRVSTSLDSSFCLDALQEAIDKYGYPEMSNTDQGCQFTSKGWIGMLLAGSVRISMDGRGRCFDNIFVERLWRSTKQEEVYLKEYKSVTELKDGIKQYFEFYNNRRLHQSLDYSTPVSVYFQVKNPENTENSNL